MTDERSEATLLIKQCLDRGDSTAFVLWMKDQGASRESVMEVLRGERARLIKIRSLGATDRIDAQLELLEKLLSEVTSS